MLTGAELVQQFANHVSVEDWKQQAQQQRHQQLIKQLGNHYGTGIVLMMGSSLFLTIAALVAMGTYMGLGIGALIASGFLVGIGLVIMGEYDGDLKPRLIRRTYNRLSAATGPAQLDAHVTTRLVDDKMLVTEVVYNGKSQEVERVVIEPDTEAAVALASRMVVRNQSIDQQLLNPQLLPQQTVSHSGGHRQLLTDVLNTPSVPESTALLSDTK